jgi:hypothetical protein
MSRFATIAAAVCLASLSQAEEIGQITLFGQTYDVTRLDYSAVHWPDPISPGFDLQLIEVEGAHWLGNDHFLLSSDAGDSLLSYKNWVVEVRIVRDDAGGYVGLEYVRTVIVSEPTIDGFDLNPCGITINPTDTGLAPRGYLVGNSEDNRVDGYSSSGSYQGFFSGGTFNDSFDDLAFCPTNNLVYTINEDGYRLVTFTTAGTFVASTPIPGMWLEYPTAPATGSPKGMVFLPDAPTVPAAIRRAGGTMLITLDDNNPGLQVYDLDGNVLATEALTDDPVNVGTSLLDQGIACGTTPLQLEAASFDVETGRLFLVNEGNFTDCSGFYILTPVAGGCPADINGDEGVDGDDVILFFAYWDASDLRADFNGDEGVDGDDVIAFFAAWDAGC